MTKSQLKAHKAGNQKRRAFILNKCAKGTPEERVWYRVFVGAIQKGRYT